MLICWPVLDFAADRRRQRRSSSEMLFERSQSATSCSYKNAGCQSDWCCYVCGWRIGRRKGRSDDSRRCCHRSRNFTRKEYNVSKGFRHLPVFSGRSREKRFCRWWSGGRCGGSIRRTNWYMFFAWILSSTVWSRRTLFNWPIQL